MFDENFCIWTHNNLSLFLFLSVRATDKTEICYTKIRKKKFLTYENKQTNERASERNKLMDSASLGWLF